jgi:enoyl-CoA hydratase/carnithine racemase
MIRDGVPAVLVEIVDGVATITLNRPDAINAINDAVRSQLPAALRQADADPAVRVIVLRGAGERGFCVGADLREKRAPQTPAQARTLPPRAAWFDAFDEVAKPTIAAVHGFCLGGGFEIALACDLRVAAADAIFGLPEIGLGLLPGGGGTQRLPRLLGLGSALHLLLTGERFDAREAWRLGLVARLADDASSLPAEAQKLAASIAAKPPLAARFTKEAVRAATTLDLQAGLRLERDLFALLASTDDHQEALAAFREKRSPQFRNQ